MNERGRHKGIVWDDQPLGLERDSEIARRLGVNRSTVQAARQHRNLPSIPKTTAFDTTYLGLLPDRAVADINHIGVMAVRSERLRRGLPPTDRKCLTQEGEGATYPEAVIDQYWHQTNTEHQFQYRVGRYRADWLINQKTVVEYAGFSDGRFYQEYQERLSEKVQFYQQSGFKVLVIVPSDLPQYQIGPPPNFTPRGFCTRCGNASARLSRLLCTPCYRKEYPFCKPQSGLACCESCGRHFGDVGPKGGTICHVAHGLCQSCSHAQREGRQVSLESIHRLSLPPPRECLDCGRVFGEKGPRGGIIQHDTAGRCKSCAKRHRKLC